MKTYIGSILYEDHQPNHWGSDILVYAMWSDIVRFYRKDRQRYKGPSTGYWCKLDCLDNLYPFDILLFGLKLKIYHTVSRSKT